MKRRVKWKMDSDFIGFFESWVDRKMMNVRKDEHGHAKRVICTLGLNPTMRTAMHSNSRKSLKRANWLLIKWGNGSKKRCERLPEQQYHGQNHQKLLGLAEKHTTINDHGWCQKFSWWRLASSLPGYSDTVEQRSRSGMISVIFE